VLFYRPCRKKKKTRDHRRKKWRHRSRGEKKKKERDLGDTNDSFSGKEKARQGDFPCRQEKDENNCPMNDLKRGDDRRKNQESGALFHERGKKGVDTKKMASKEEYRPTLHR